MNIFVGCGKTNINFDMSTVFVQKRTLFTSLNPYK